MKKSFTPLILILLVIAFAFICLETNPTSDEYSTWVSKEYIPNMTNSSGITEVFAQLVGPKIITESTISKNYLFFSLYEIHFGQGDTVKVLGLLDHFFILNQSPS